MYRQRLQNLAREAHFPIAEFGEDHFHLTGEIIGDLRVKSYMDQWTTAIANRWFHVRMQDHSLFLFNDIGYGSSYAYIHCPIAVMSFSEFLAELKLDDNPQNRRELKEQYDQIFDTASERESVTPIRFDYDRISYRPGIHPLAHIHVGLDNQVRIALSRKMNPVSFVLFVMRHMYPRSWERLLTRAGREQFFKHIREPEGNLPEDYWGEIDRLELHLA